MCRNLFNKQLSSPRGGFLIAPNTNPYARTWLYTHLARVHMNDATDIFTRQFVHLPVAARALAYNSTSRDLTAVRYTILVQRSFGLFLRVCVCVWILVSRIIIMSRFARWRSTMYEWNPRASGYCKKTPNHLIWNCSRMDHQAAAAVHREHRLSFSCVAILVRYTSSIYSRFSVRKNTFRRRHRDFVSGKDVARAIPRAFLVGRSLKHRIFSERLCVWLIVVEIRLWFFRRGQRGSCEIDI